MGKLITTLTAHDCENPADTFGVWLDKNYCNGYFLGCGARSIGRVTIQHIRLHFFQLDNGNFVVLPETGRMGLAYGGSIRSFWELAQIYKSYLINVESEEQLKRVASALPWECIKWL